MTHSLCRNSFFSLLLISAVSFFSILSGCKCTSEPPEYIPQYISPTEQQTTVLSSTFQGTTFDGKSVRITLNQKGNTVTGNGLIGNKRCSISGITSQYGPIIVTFEDGRVTPATVAISPAGNTATIKGFGQPLVVNRGGKPVKTSSGPFAGNYKTAGPPPLTLTLTQGGKLLAGTGFVEGKPIAVVGKVIGSNKASGAILFSDESRNIVKATLSGDGRILTILGFGSPIEMARE